MKKAWLYCLALVAMAFAMTPAMAQVGPMVADPGDAPMVKERCTLCQSEAAELMAEIKPPMIEVVGFAKVTTISPAFSGPFERGWRSSTTAT